MNVFPIIFKIDVENPLFPYHAFSTSFCMSTPQVPPILRDDRRVFFSPLRYLVGLRPTRCRITGKIWQNDHFVMSKHPFLGSIP